MNTQLLQGKRILITGGGSGLGAAMAKSFAEWGADLVLSGRRQDRLEAVAKSIEESTKKTVLCAAVDIRDGEAVRSLVDELWAKGPIHGLVNNAAGNFASPTERLSQRAFHAVFDCVASGSFYLTHALGQKWLADSIKASVVSISTTYASAAGPHVVPSAMGKAAVEAMTRSLAVEWGNRGIRLNAVSPGMIPTDGAWQQLFAGLKRQAFEPGDFIPQQRVGQTTELDQLVGFLLSDLCPFLTGVVIPLDGGMQLASGAGAFDQLFRDLSDEQWDRLKAFVKGA